MLKIFEKLNTNLHFRLKLMNIAQHKQYVFNKSYRRDIKQIYCEISLHYCHIFEGGSVCYLLSTCTCGYIHLWRTCKRKERRQLP